MNNAVQWDLSDLFSSIDDPEIFNLIEKTKAAADEFRKKYHNNLAQYANPLKILEIIKEYEAILSDAVKPQTYGELLFTVETNNPSVGAFLQKVRAASTEIFSQLLFFELELSSLSQQQFQTILTSEELVAYHHFFEKLYVWKTHRLGEKEEQILEYKSLTGRQAFVRLFEQELSQQKFSFLIDGQEQNLDQSQMLNILYTSEKQSERQKAAQSFTKGLLQKESVLTFVMNTLAEDKKIEDNLRHFSFPEQARHLENEASKEAVEAMAEIVEENYHLVQDYYQFKQKVLGLEKIYDYDRYAPVFAGGKKYTFAQAQELVLASFANFNPEFKEIAANFFQKNWIDAALAEGKRGGAYCSSSTPDMHAYVFMNFTGSNNDVMTLAHELGHGINFELARKQSFVNFNNPLTLAETASIFAETLTFQKLVETEKDEKVLLGLYMQKIESIFASVHRQISMFRFEQDFHSAYRQRGELSNVQINQLWRKRQEQMFGRAIELGSDYDNWWLYISHFIHTPFYVYAYAFGELLALGLLEKCKADPDKFYQQYRQFLEAAGSKSPAQLAQLFAVDLDQPDFWKGGMKIVQEYILKAKSLHQAIEQQNK